MFGLHTAADDTELTFLLHSSEEINQHLDEQVSSEVRLLLVDTTFHKVLFAHLQ